MNEILVAGGVVSLLAAVIGGNIDAFKVRFPPIEDWRVRTALGALGVAFLIAAVVLRSDDGGGGNNSAEARYQRQAVSTCTAVRRLGKRNTIGVPGPNLTFNRSTIVTGGRANIEAIDNRIGLLLDRAVPKGLRDEAATLRQRTKAFVTHSRASLRTLESSLPPNPTIDQLQAAVAPLQERADRDKARLEDALGSLADHDCSL
jgi:hypothetical protein